MTRLLRVLVADDDGDVRDALADLIGDDAGLELVGAARDAEETIAVARAQQPDIAIVDVAMPGGGGVRATVELLLVSPATRVIVLSSFQDQSTIDAMKEAGATRYLVKGDPDTDLIAAIRQTADGEA
jgi:DNA-binding NarL/FixJ family response regulator